MCVCVGGGGGGGIKRDGRDWIDSVTVSVAWLRLSDKHYDMFEPRPLTVVSLYLHLSNSLWYIRIQFEKLF